jgi:hypothetical protein
MDLLLCGNLRDRSLTMQGLGCPRSPCAKQNTCNGPSNGSQRQKMSTTDAAFVFYVREH